MLHGIPIKLPAKPVKPVLHWKPKTPERKPPSEKLYGAKS